MSYMPISKLLARIVNSFLGDRSANGRPLSRNACGDLSGTGSICCTPLNVTWSVLICSDGAQARGFVPTAYRLSLVFSAL